MRPPPPAAAALDTHRQYQGAQSHSAHAPRPAQQRQTQRQRRRAHTRTPTAATAAPTPPRCRASTAQSCRRRVRGPFGLLSAGEEGQRATEAQGPAWRASAAECRWAGATCASKTATAGPAIPAGRCLKSLRAPDPSLPLPPCLPANSRPQRRARPRRGAPRGARAAPAAGRRLGAVRRPRARRALRARRGGQGVGDGARTGGRAAASCAGCVLCMRLAVEGRKRYRQTDIYQAHAHHLFPPPLRQYIRRRSARSRRRAPCRGAARASCSPPAA